MDHGLCGGPGDVGLSFARRRRYFLGVGRTYHFECPYCHYRARVSGGTDTGIHCEVQTVVCRDCRELVDVFTCVRRPAEVPARKFPVFFRPEIPPVILQDGINRQRLVWQKFRPACPLASKHIVECWSDPGRCPRCGNFMEKNGLPTQIWD